MRYNYGSCHEIDTQDATINFQIMTATWWAKNSKHSMYTINGKIDEERKKATATDIYLASENSEKGRKLRHYD